MDKSTTSMAVGVGANAKEFAILQENVLEIRICKDKYSVPIGSATTK